METNCRLCLICLVVAAMLGSLAACGSGTPSESGATATAQPTATTAPTPTPRPTPPPTPGTIDPAVQGLDMVQALAAAGGDAATLLLDGKPEEVAYLGVVVPAGGEAGSPGAAAAAANAEFLSGHWVFLEGDGDRDDSGRRRFYVWLADGRLVNEELIRAGVARLEDNGLDVAHRERLLAAQATAVADKASLIEISSIRLDGTGKAQPDEYIEFTNPGESGLDMSGWRIEAGHVEQFFVFPTGFVLTPGQACRLYTNQVLDDSCGGCTFGHNKPILNNDGDCGQVYDTLGLLIVERCVERGEN